MGRQSSRLYFQGKDHKDIYYNGHWHDEMYLTDSEGNAALVWEKLKKVLDIKTYFLAYDDELYIAIISRKMTTRDAVIYSGKDIYNMDAVNIKNMFKADVYVSSMFIFNGKLEIVFGEYPTLYSYSIPISSGKLDTDNITVNKLEGCYWIEYRTLVGRTRKTYEASLYHHDTDIAAKAGIIINNRAISYGEDFEFISYGVFFVAGKIFVDALVAKSDINDPVRYLELNDKETELVLREVYLPASFIQQFKSEALKDYLDRKPTNIKNEWSYTYELKKDSNHAGSVSIINNTKGFIYFELWAQNGNSLYGKPFNYDGGIYKAIIDFTNFSIIRLEKVEDTAIYSSQGFSKNWRVQSTFKRKGGGVSGNHYLSYGRISDTNDNYIAFSDIDGMNDVITSRGEFTCVAEIDNLLYVGMKNGTGYAYSYYICIDTETNKAKLLEFNIGIKK